MAYEYGAGGGYGDYGAGGGAGGYDDGYGAGAGGYGAGAGGYGAGAGDYGAGAGGYGGGAGGYGGGYDGAAQGGYMQSPAGGMGGAEESPSRRRGGGTAQTLTPCTTAQLMLAQQPHAEGPFKLDGVEIHLVNVVAKILEIKESATTYTVRVNDGTTSQGVEVRFWVDASAPDSLTVVRPFLREGMYVSVFGHLRTFAGTRNIVGYRIIIVEDFNQITYHGLQAVQVHLQRTKGAPPASSAVLPMATSSTTSAYTGGYGAPISQQQRGQELAPRIQAFIRSKASGDYGVSLAALCSGLQLSASVVRDECERMVNDGVMYATNDEEWTLTG
eukprot:CAMPEP_0177640282 /NCGR_PEP_ID=MMETSP0447-20121125/6462_1 /TAXON_ID=0 /ORGANISM="Stygamoeba regulata, Strain BSH-02190019" /LENGTH=329 /DNA_ID=CAMNT_0019142347 /DNA_START=27 /DNA_END=1016 /DNA_ORIENTATION=+